MKISECVTHFYNYQGMNVKKIRYGIINSSSARIVVKKAGDLVGIHLKPHDLRRHAATAWG